MGQETMIENPCLRPACLGDWCPNGILDRGYRDRGELQWNQAVDALEAMYTAEWKRRGFEGSPRL